VLFIIITTTYTLIICRF